MTKIVEELREFLKEPRPDVGARGSHSWAFSMAERLTGLHDRFSLRIRAAEKSEFLEELSLKRPHAVRPFRRLRQDHDRLLADLRSIQGAAVVYSQGKRPANPRLRRWTLSVLDRLSQHEHQETELIQRALYLDTGAAG
jgi:hypothetical protein